MNTHRPDGLDPLHDWFEALGADTGPRVVEPRDARREARVALGREPTAEDLKPFLEDVALENEFQSKYGRGWNTWRGLVGSLAGSSDGRRTAATNPTEVATNRARARSCLHWGLVTLRTGDLPEVITLCPSGLLIARAIRHRTLHRHSERNRSGDRLSSRSPDRRAEKTRDI